MQPNRSQQPQHNYRHPQNNSALAAQAVAAALSNPYGQTYGANQFAQASHYAQAYAQYYNAAGPSNVTAEGYTISSTYDPRAQYNNPYQHQQQQQQHPHPHQRQQREQQKSNSQRPQHHGGGGQAQGGWYQPGSDRCSQQGCTFTGSKKSVEIHMMDRHLIYPPGWEKRKKRDDWDADPSLKGKPIFIQGTSIRLDTPEAIEQWLAERKKRFPTKEHVEDKERKMREAVERGQIPFDDGSRRKRKRVEDAQGDWSGNQRGRGGQRGRGRGRGRGRAVDGGWEGRQSAGQSTEVSAAAPHGSATSASAPQTGETSGKDEDALSKEDDSGSDSDSDGAPEAFSSKAPPGAPQPSDENAMEEVETEQSTEAANTAVATEPANRPPEPVKKPRPRQPRRPLYNPFAQRPSLLRNLLLPEIRMTVSNLSQAIHFLVDNDFLDNVELKPGQANERMIQVVGEQAAPSEPETASSAESSAVTIVPPSGQS
ncbi:hypothetical protein PYCCODRAFT_1476971 [Trametes coccinea BRFM310]|uniref:FMR1-interacting protein 1 conserved domain-containing protein n=1 Tax=Trametes coccinea (strain BRFM310) TaxID=1353009 RepID=A0A1Y2ITQ5_TRAC3|nr:hypothetical protein PYCCODRAFT_1476971 [Trametes coccinea BRFM310]